MTNIAPKSKDFMYFLGLLHDIGKYQPSFQKRINGQNIKIEHSLCGEKEVNFKFNDLNILARLCILGHHSGIPNSGTRYDTKEKSTLNGRMKRKTEDYSIYKSDIGHLIINNEINETKIIEFFKSDCKNKDDYINKFAFLTRYCFLCLTDADSVDTAEFCECKKSKTLFSNFKKCLEKVNEKLPSFICKTDLQKTRTLIQKKKIDLDSEIYLMNMPTGSGKTLCSLKFALEKAIKKIKKE